MKILLPLILYFLIIISILQNWLWLAGGLVVWFSSKYGAISLILVAILIDGYYGNFYTVPYLSFYSVAWYIFVSFFRRKLLNKTENY